jgi:DnaJ-class molecular chaperone
MELIFIAAIVLVLYLSWDRFRHPRKFCPKCQGTGRRTSRINGRAYGACQRCGGKGTLHR